MSYREGRRIDHTSNYLDAVRTPATEEETKEISHREAVLFIAQITHVALTDPELSNRLVGPHFTQALLEHVPEIRDQVLEEFGSSER